MKIAAAAAWAQGKTPMLVDMTTPAGENKSQAFSPLETFYSYSGDVLIEAKKAIVELSVKKEKTIDELRDEFAKKLLMGLKQGRELILLLSNSAPPLKSQFAHPELFPYELLDAAKVRAVLGTDVRLEDTFLAGLIKHKDSQPSLKSDPSYNLVFAHDDFRVALVTKFEPDQYKEFLASELDFDLLQVIKVTAES